MYGRTKVRQGAEKRTRVNQLGAVLYSNLDNLVAGEISSDRGVLASLANDVGFIGLCGKAVSKSSHAEGVHIRVAIYFGDA